VNNKKNMFFPLFVNLVLLTGRNEASELPLIHNLLKVKHRNAFQI